MFSTLTFSSCSSKTPLDSSLARRRARGSSDDKRFPVFRESPIEVNFFTRDAVSANVDDDDADDDDFDGAVAGVEEDEDTELSCGRGATCFDL
jgi:hypothetical protein